ncbi:MAG: hypothetical protein HY722_00915 [Planctomycetes bacterium]|nr:hypothetical protein [Planctomycetota bacterium]
MTRALRRGLLALLLSGCPGPPPPSAAQAPAAGSVVAVAVGERAWTPEDLELRARLVLQGYPEYRDPHLAALAQVVEGGLYLEVCRAFGRPFTEEALDAELARIDRETQDPERLAARKALAGGAATRGYRWVLAGLDLANRHFSAVYPTLESVHGGLAGRARAFVERLQAGGAQGLRAAAAREEGAEYRECLFSPAFGFRDEREVEAEVAPDYLDPGGAGVYATIEARAFAGTPAGQLHHGVASTDDAFLVLCWTGWYSEERGIRRVVVVRFPKRPLEEVFWEHAAKVPVWVANEALASRLREKVEWAAGLHWVERP